MIVQFLSWVVGMHVRPEFYFVHGIFDGPLLCGSTGLRQRERVLLFYNISRSRMLGESDNVP